MPDTDQPAQGERIAHLRRRLGLTQAELAARLDRSESWVSQVERGVHTIERMPMLRAVADALQVEPTAIQTDIEAPSPERPGSDLSHTRLALTGHAALLTTMLRATRRTLPLDELRARVDDAWTAVHASRFIDADPLLAGLIPDLEAAAVDDSDPDALTLLASTYQAAAAAFARQDESDAAWVAADRAITTAQRSDDPLNAVAGLFRAAHVFIRLKRSDQADKVITDAIAVLEPLTDAAKPDPGVISLLGAITLVDAVNKASEGRRQEARVALSRAEALAKRLGGDRNDYATEFGPTNVKLHAIAIAVDLGDAGEALDTAAKVDASGLSPERQGRFYIDVARAHTQRRQLGDALAALLRAEQVSPEQVRGHHLARKTIDELLRLAGRRPSAQLTALAQRAAVTEAH